MWAEKYRPKSMAEVVGNELAKEEFLRWISKYRSGRAKEKGLFLIGPQGVGKTSFVHAATKELDFHVFELNASDVRSGKALESALINLPRQKPMDSYIEGREKSEMVFLDEVEGIHGVSDRGGLKTLLDFADRREMLLVLSANFPDPRKHRKLISGFKVIRFNPLNMRHLLALLERVADEEESDVSPEKIVKIAALSRGDARFALTKLQEATFGYGELEDTWVETLPLKETVTRLLGDVSLQEGREMISSSLATPENIYKALAESVASADLPLAKRADTLDSLSKVDVLMGRIRRRNLWKLYRELILMIPGAIEDLNGGEAGFREGIPQYVFYRWTKRRKRSTLEDVAKKLGRRLHMSSRKTLHDLLPYLPRVVEAGGRPVEVALGITEEERDILLEVFA